MVELYIKQSRNGKGVFTKSDIKKLEFILGFRGKIMSFEGVRRYNLDNYALQIGRDRYLVGTGILNFCVFIFVKKSKNLIIAFNRPYKTIFQLF